MAHGFRYIPKRRTAAPPQPPCCGFCGARTDLGMAPHICKEITYGTFVLPTAFLPLTSDDGEARLHFGAGGTGISTGAGPWTAYKRLGRTRRRR